jgi:hypothetical protein
MYASMSRRFLPQPAKFLKDLTELGKTRPPLRHKPGMTTNHLADSEHCLSDGSDGSAVNVVTWRRCRLLESGFAPDLAQQLASTPAVDVHALLQLVDRGCPPDLAARILSPLGVRVPGLSEPGTPAGSA